MCPSLNEAGEFNSLNEYACLKECVYVRGTEKERELVSMCVSQCVCVCVCVSRGSILYTIVLECVRERERERECVCVCVFVC